MCANCTPLSMFKMLFIKCLRNNVFHRSRVLYVALSKILVILRQMLLSVSRL